jgi:hypothetical protein
VPGTGYSREALPVMVPRQRRPDDAAWIPPGSHVAVRGFSIPGGMVYVGEFMSASPGGSWDAGQPAPCLINPALKVAPGPARTGSDMGYWPSYTDITPEHRLNYLTWLSTGKRDPSFPVGYAFLYFYGIERRLLLGSPAPEEEALLTAEIGRLQRIYGSNHSFSAYSRSLLQLAELRRALDGPGLDTWKPDLDTPCREMSLPLRVKLAMKAASGVPADFEHAMAAVLCLPPHMGGVRQGIGMTRARPEFIALARKRFAKRYPDGFRLQCLGAVPLSLAYRAAARHLHVDIVFDGPRLPDPLALPWAGVADICGKAASDLEPFARIAGKDRARAASIAAALALPPEIADAGAAEPFMAWLGGLPKPLAEVPVKELGAWCFGPGMGCAGAAQAREVSGVLARFGYGMEPDPARGSGTPGARVVLFRDACSPVPAGAAFLQAGLAIAILASGGDGPDGGPAAAEVALRLQLSPADALRLEARHRMMSGRTLTAKRLAALAPGLSAGGRREAAALAAATAAACGNTGRGAMAALERACDAFGVERRALYAILHRGAASASVPAADPVEVSLAAAGPAASAGRFRIPPPQPEPGAAPTVDMARVSAILRETHDVARVLAPIYAEDDPAAAEPAAATAAETAGSRFPGLDSRHAGFLAALAGQPSWTRAEFGATARGFGLMPDGALETINEWAYDTLGEELVADGDPLAVNMALLPEARGGES